MLSPMREPQGSLSNFAERAVKVLASRGELDWDIRDSRGYTPLMLAAFHGNVWLVRHLLDTVGVNPNDEQQRTLKGVDVVVGSTGFLCCKQDVKKAGTVGGQTPLMCAAKGSSVGALKILLSHEADVRAADGEGRSALAYAMMLDKLESLECARLLLAAGSRTTMPGPMKGKDTKGIQITDIIGESWAHRAVRYGEMP